MLSWSVLLGEKERKNKKRPGSFQWLTQENAKLPRFCFLYMQPEAQIIVNCFYFIFNVKFFSASLLLPSFSSVAMYNT